MLFVKHRQHEQDYDMDYDIYYNHFPFAQENFAKL